MSRIAVLIETSTGWGTGIVRGIAQYVEQEAADWHVHFESRGKFERMELPEQWSGEGVIARVNTSTLADQIVASGLPCVNVSWYAYGGDAIARCTLDEEANGQIAAEYYVDKRYVHFAYCGSPWRHNYVDLFGRAYVDALRQHGFGCAVYPAESLPEGRPWFEQLAVFATWLNELPRPCALLTIDTETARQLVEAAKMCGLSVPQDIAILAGDYDELSCRLCHPKLSMLDNSAETVGYRAAQLLQRLMSGEATSQEMVKIAPGGVVANQSTDWTVLSDASVTAALRFIRDNYRKPIQVTDVVGHAGVSRRALEQRFREHLDCTPSRQIAKVRLAHAAKLLEQTQLPMPTVAARSGFDSAEVMCRLFGRELRLSPSEYRKAKQ